MAKKNYFSARSRCPQCKNRFLPNELVSNPVVKQTKRIPEWYEVAHMRDRLRCPHCNTALKPSLRSYWPLLLLIPATLAYRILPVEYATGLFVLVGVFVAGMLRYGIEYRVVGTSPIEKNQDQTD